MVFFPSRSVPIGIVSTNRSVFLFPTAQNRRRAGHGGSQRRTIHFDFLRKWTSIPVSKRLLIEDAYFGRARHFLFETNGVPSGKYVSEDGNKMSFFDGQAGSREREIASGGGRATLATDSNAQRAERQNVRPTGFRRGNGEGRFAPFQIFWNFGYGFLILDY